MIESEKNGGGAMPTAAVAVVERVPPGLEPAPMPETLEVNIPDWFTLGNLAELDDPETKIHRLMFLLDACVIGGAKQFSLRALRAVAEAVARGINEASNPKG